MNDLCVAVVGATGLVGQTVVKILEERNFPVGRLKLFASTKSCGKQILFKGKNIGIDALENSSFVDVDIALFCVPAEISKKFVPIAVNEGAYVVDNSSCFRLEEDVPLVVPEVNGGEVCSGKRVISNPNCSTIQCVLPISALKSLEIKRASFVTYQSVSGSGYKGISALNQALLGNNEGVYPYDISKTCIPRIGEINENGYSEEELKMIYETKKILEAPCLNVSATCVRVPVAFCHGAAVTLEFKKEINVESVKEMLAAQNGVMLCDYPNSIDAVGQDKVYVGRIRKDLFDRNTVHFYCTCDNVRKGAATNAVQIAELVVKEKGKK